MSYAIFSSSSKWSSQCILLIIALSWGSRGWVKTPPGLQGLGHLPGLGELEVTSLLRHNGTLMLRGQLGHQLGDKSAGLLGVEVTLFLRDIHQGGHNLVMALLFPLLIGAASTTDLNGQFLTGGVTNKLARLLLNILSGT